MNKHLNFTYYDKHFTVLPPDFPHMCNYYVKNRGGEDVAHQVGEKLAHESIFFKTVTELIA